MLIISCIIPLNQLDYELFAFFFFTLCLGVCPVLCSGRGTYGGGRCHCELGWAGPECDQPSEQDSSGSVSGFVISCSIPCTVHGTCVNGRCQCDAEHTGAACETRKFLLSVFSCNPMMTRSVERTSGRRAKGGKRRNFGRSLQ